MYQKIESYQKDLFTSTPLGKKRVPREELVSQWIHKAWQEIPAHLVGNAFNDQQLPSVLIFCCLTASSSQIVMLRFCCGKYLAIRRTPILALTCRLRTGFS